MIVNNMISDFGEFGVLYGYFYTPSLDLEVTELFGRAGGKSVGLYRRAQSYSC
jgi:hypothetical protein